MPPRGALDLTKRRSVATYVGPALGQLQLSGLNVSPALGAHRPPSHAGVPTPPIAPSASWPLTVTDCPFPDGMHRSLSSSPLSALPHYSLSPVSIRIFRRCDRAIPSVCSSSESITTRPHFLVLSARSSLALCLLPAARFGATSPACRRFTPFPVRLRGSPQFPFPHRVSAICLASSSRAPFITGLPFSQNGRHESLHGAPVSGWPPRHLSRASTTRRAPYLFTLRTSSTLATAYRSHLSAQSPDRAPTELRQSPTEPDRPTCQGSKRDLRRPATGCWLYGPQWTIGWRGPPVDNGIHSG